MRGKFPDENEKHLGLQLVRAQRRLVIAASTFPPPWLQVWCSAGRGALVG